MIKHLLFLRWWLLVVLVALGATVCHRFGVYEKMWEMDNTKLSFVILSLTAMMTLWIGTATWQVGRMLVGSGSVRRARLKYIELTEDTAWFISDIVLTLGMIGTVCGFIAMLMSGFGGIDASDPNTLKVMLAKMSNGMATALFTTLAGLISSVVLKLQAFNLTQSLEQTRKGHLHEIVGGSLDEAKKLSL